MENIRAFILSTMNLTHCSYHFILNISEPKVIDSLFKRLNKTLGCFTSPSTIQPYSKAPNKLEVFGYIELPELSFAESLLWLCKSFQPQFSKWQMTGDFEHEINLNVHHCKDKEIYAANFTLIT